MSKTILKISHWKTSNGAEVLFVPSHELTMLDIQVTFNAGSARDAAHHGIAQFVNAMLNEGTKNLTADEIASSFDGVGAQFGNYIDHDMAGMQLRSLTNPKALKTALTTFTSIINEPTFNKAAFARVEQQLLSAIQQEQQQPEAIADNAFYKAIYGNSGYGTPILGTAKSLKALTPTELQEFYDHYYVAKNATVAIVGDITKSEAKTIAEQLVGNLKSGTAAPQLPETAKLSAAKSEHIEFPAEQTSILLGQIAIGWHDKDFFPLTVGNFILGKSPLTSELFEEVRNKRGLAYSVGSGFSLMQRPGPFTIYLQTRTEQSQKAIAVARKTLAKFIKDGPSAKQLKATKKSMIGRFPLKFTNNAQILNVLTTIGFYHLPWDYLDTYRDNVDKVTLKQIKTAFQQHITPDKMVLVTVGKK